MTEFSKNQDNNGIAELTKIFSSSIPLIQSIFQSNMSTHRTVPCVSLSLPVLFCRTVPCLAAMFINYV